MPEVSLEDVEPPAEAVRYSARDADATIRVYADLEPKIKAMKLDRVLEMDLGIVPMVDRMQEVGWLIDVPYFHELTKNFEKQMRQLQNEMNKLAGRWVNPASGDQIAELLFGEYELPIIKMTKSKLRGSTDDKSLEALSMQLRPEDERGSRILGTILHYRELQKLVGTYTRPLPLWARRTGRVHPHLRLTRTASGRLASFSPSLQNIPIKPKRGRDNGKQIRAGFICGEGRRLGGWDLNQIEMRVLAHESGDPNLTKLFVQGAMCVERDSEGKCLCHDIHRYTASLIYRKGVAEITDDERLLAKNIGFGIIYGITAKGLKAQMDVRGQRWTESECQDMIDAYLKRAYPGVGGYMEERAAEARRYGHVRDMFGRIRYLPAVHSTAGHIAAEAIRQAGNHPIQAGAQGIIKLAMREVWKALEMLRREGVWVECLMQIHDELILEFEDGAEVLLDGMVKRALNESVQLRVPVESSSHFGQNWSELK